MIWKYEPGQLPRFGLTWWLDEYNFGAAFHFPVWIYLSAYWSHSSAFMLLGFCLKTMWAGFNFQRMKFAAATDLAKRVGRLLKYRILVREFFCSFSGVWGLANRSAGKQTRLYSLRELRDRKIGRL